jgi:protocatechuate 3,4-dioxygenase beta subunit
VIVAILAVVAGGAWWWSRSHPREPATSTVVQPQRGSAPAAGRPAGTAAAQAGLTITVSDDHGPLAGATVRLAPAGGDIVVVATDHDGVARAEHLEPGTWNVSAAAADHLPTALTRHLAPGADDHLAIKLTSGGRPLTGTVSDATGGPIAGARIDAARLTRQARPDGAVSTTLTGADGTYRLTVPEGAVLVAAASPDYAAQSRYVEIGPTGAVADFSLVPGGVIDGVVRDERTKQPVAGARVVARRDSPAMMLAEAGTRHITTGSDGRFHLGGLRPGAWELTATDQGRHTKAPTTLGLGVAEQITDVELMLGPTPVIRGRVVDDAGKAVAGTSVRAVTRGTSHEVATDPTGAFLLDGLPPATYALSASGDGYLPRDRTTVELADRDVDGVVVTVRRGTSVTGHVEPRQPCELAIDPFGSTVDLASGAPRSSTATAGADGAFTIGPVLDGGLKLTARCASGDQGEAQIQVASGMPDLVVAVAPGASIAGRVLDGDGKPFAGAGVVASEVSRGEHIEFTNGRITSGAQAMTDSTGAYHIGGLTAGSYQVTALDRGRPLRLRSKPPQIELAATEHKTGVDLTAERSNGTIRGTVTGPDDRPLADAWVSAVQSPLDLAAMAAGARPGGGSSYRQVSVQASSTDGEGGDASAGPTLTDAQGHYELTGLPPATYTVVAEAQRGQLRARAPDIKPDATVDLRALGLSSLAGHVTGPAGPVAAFSVELAGPTAAQRSFTDGSYSFARVDPGTYTVRVQATEGNGSATVTVTPDQPATLDIALTANAVVIGKLVDPSGAPIAGQALALTPDPGDGHLQLMLDGPPPTTAADGSFRLEHRAERCALLVMRPPQPTSRRGLVLEPGKTLDLGTITIAPPAPPTAPGGPGAPTAPGGFTGPRGPVVSSHP